jgi:type II secretory pathway pseudopilin PulG
MRGFFIYEMIIGMGILAVAALVLFVATTRTHLASSRFADARAATRAAEAALINLQAGLPPGELDKETRVQVTPIQPASPAPAGWQWVDVTATVRGQARTLTGLVPQHAPTTAPAEGGAR